MTDKMACKMPECAGKIDLNKVVNLQASGMTSAIFFACGVCGRVHSRNGNLIYNSQGVSIYRREDGTTYLVNEKPVFEVGKKYKTKWPLYVQHESISFNEENDDDREWVDIGPETPLTFDGDTDDGQYRFHDECGIKYLLDRGDLNGVEKHEMPIMFVVGSTYKTKCHTHVCLEGTDGDCMFADMVELPQETQLVFDSQEGDKYRFRDVNGTEYHLHHNDIENVEEM